MNSRMANIVELDESLREKRRAQSRERVKRWLEKHPEKARERWRRNTQRWLENHPDYQVEMRKKRLAKTPDYDRHVHLRRLYGITPQQYDEMFLHQGGCCAICRQPEVACFRGVVKRLAVDHCHESGEVRGLLCANCNRMIGIAKENEMILRNAIDYLRRA